MSTITALDLQGMSYLLYCLEQRKPVTDDALAATQRIFNQLTACLPTSAVGPIQLPVVAPLPPVPPPLSLEQRVGALEARLGQAEARLVDLVGQPMPFPPSPDDWHRRPFLAPVLPRGPSDFPPAPPIMCQAGPDDVPF